MMVAKLMEYETIYLSSGATSIIAIGPGWMRLVKICIYKKHVFTYEMTQLGPSKYHCISINHTTGYCVSTDTKYGVVHPSHLSKAGIRI